MRYNLHMKKIKKWQVLVLIILGIGGYWLSQNLWVFENKIESDNYVEFLSNTKWKSQKRNSIWNFNGDLTFEEAPITATPYNKSEATWDIDGNYLIQDDSILGGAEWLIHVITEKTMVIQLKSPSVGGHYSIKLKKVQ